MDLPPPSFSATATSAQRSSGSNVLALVSFIAGLYPLVVVLVIIFFSLLHIAVLIRIADVLGFFTIPAVLCAIVTGHIALVLAKKYPPDKARRGFAIAGLVLGYLGLLVIIGFVVLVIYVVRNFT